MKTASLKVCIFGDTRVGKTSLIQRFLINRFLEDTKATIGVDIFTTDLELENYNIKLQVWDVAGAPKFKVFMPIYAKGSSGGIFMYDLTRKQSFDNLAQWISLFQKNLVVQSQTIPILGVGGKKDLSNQRIVHINTENCNNSINSIYDFMECSAKTGENVQKIFKSLTNEILTTRGFI
ncbi:MAG: Rab family GTPase [Promethearchaeota archaeon]